MKQYIFFFIAITFAVGCTDSKFNSIQTVATPAFEEKSSPVVLKDRLDTLLFETLSELGKISDSINTERSSSNEKDAEGNPLLRVSIVDFESLTRQQNGAYEIFSKYYYTQPSWGKTYFSNAYEVNLLVRDTTIVATSYHSCDCVKDGSISGISKTLAKKGEFLITNEGTVVIHTKDFNKAKKVLIGELQSNSPVDNPLFAMTMHYLGIDKEKVHK